MDQQHGRAPSSTRRQFLGRSAAIGVAAAVTGSASALGPRGAVAEAAQGGKAQDETNTMRAVASYDAMQKYFYHPDVKLYQEQYPFAGGNAYSYVWPFSQAFAATTYIAGLRGLEHRYRDDVQDRITGLEPYYSATGRSPNAAITPNYPSPPGYDSYLNAPYGNGGDKYYDDDGWLGIDFLQWYAMSGDPRSLQKAQEIFRLEQAGWDNDRTHPRPGGIFWTQGSWAPSRSVMENATTATMGVHLFWVTGDRDYVRWAEQTYDWVRRSLLSSEGLYWDSVALDGYLYENYWSYNQGTMVGAAAALYRATGQRAYLGQAEAVANAALSYYESQNRLWQQPSYFNAIMFKNLLIMESLNHDRRYREAMQSYADTVWQQYRDPATGVFRFSDQPAPLLDQAAMVQIYALLGRRDRNDRLV